MNIIITGTGASIPPMVKRNRDFIHNTFYDAHGQLIDQPQEITINKFEEITGIAERRYSGENVQASDLAAQAASEAIRNAGIDPETLDQIIVAHNFGDVLKHTIQTDMVPSLASRVKNLLSIENPNCVAYDLIFGCPGWVQGVIHAMSFIQSGMAKRCLVIGAEALSRVLDPHDRDSMIFADGAGAVIIEGEENPTKRGILGYKAQTLAQEETHMIRLGPSNYPGSDSRVRFIKMDGRKVYELALNRVPQAMRECLDEAGIEIGQLKKIFIHQANDKMDEAIVKRFYKLYGIPKVPEWVVPMNIHELGNSSVATVPTLFHQVLKEQYKGYRLKEGDVVMFASIGAGMNINAVVYRM